MMNEKELDQLLEIEEKDVIFDKSLRRKMNKKIYLRSIITVIIVCLIIVCGYFGTSFILDWKNYDPCQENGIVAIDDDFKVDHNFDILMQTYIEMTYIGKTYIATSYEDQSIKSFGFGKYTIAAKIQNLFEPLMMDEQSNTTFTISHSKLDISTTQNNILTLVINEFKDPHNKGFQAVTSLKEIQKELNQLPDSTVLDVSISFKDYQSLDSIIQYIKKYPDSTFTWLALKDQECATIKGISGGMSLFDTTLYSLTDTAEKKYPCFYLENHLTKENLQQNYLSRLQLLIDHPDFVRLLSTYFGNNISLEILQDNYNKAKKEMKGYGLRVYTNKKDLLSMLEKGNLSYVYINDLKLSQYQK